MTRAKRPARGWERRLQGRDFAIELIQQLAVPTFVIDADGRVIVWNHACEQLTGMPAADVIGTREHWRAFHETPRPCLADLLLQGRGGELARQDGVHDSPPDAQADAHAETWCLMPLRGVKRYLALDARPLRDARGRMIGVVETLRDLTERHRAERQLSFVASVFEHSQEGILITAPDTRILDVNAAFTRITGYGRDEVLGRTPSILGSGLQDAAFYRALWVDLTRDGHWQGEIWNRKKSGELYPEILRINAVRDAAGEVSHYIGMFLDISDLKSTQQQLISLTRYDALTHLPNRTLLACQLHQAMARAKHHERLVAICSLDLDDFKGINDRFGHAAGDRLLVEVAQRLVGVLRADDTAARLGGDEFVLLIANLLSADELEEILRRIFERIAGPYRIGEVAITISASIGVTLYPLDDQDPDTLLRHADQSMYQAKQLGRNRHHLFDLQAAKDLQARHLELERIRVALRRGEFRLHYQPRVNMRTGRVLGVEALLRWQRPDGCLLGPMEFLPLAEQSSLIVEIGEWVLRESLAQMRHWVARGVDLSVSVNLSVRHFQHLDFLARLQAILAEYSEVRPDRLELEILESAALEDIVTMRALMGACQSIGVTFALDDFGTGYSSLSYLKQLPAETLKIDRSFVRDMLDDRDDLAIIEGVVGLARVFGKDVIAEGVESPEHGLLLMRLGCDCAQGFGIARPMPAERIPSWLREFEPDWKWDAWARNHLSHVDMPLLLAQYDCAHWVERLIEHLDRARERATPLADAAPPSPCARFSNWLRGEGRTFYGHLPEYREVDHAHERLHCLGHEIVQLRAAGGLDAARAMREELIALKARTLTGLEHFQRRVAIR